MFKGLLKRIQHLAAALSLLLFILIAVELWLRQDASNTPSGLVDQSFAKLEVLMEPSGSLHHRLRPKTNHNLEGISYEVNEIGLRSRLPDPEAPFRILVLGGTAVFGFGLQEAETLPARLEQFFHEEGRQVEVQNGGVPGYSPLLSAIHFGQELHRMAPDLVLLYLDEESTKFEGRHHRLAFESDGKLSCPHPSSQKTSASHSVTAWLNTSAIANRLGEVLCQSPRGAVTGHSSKSFAFALSELNRRVSANGIPLIVCQAPNLCPELCKQVQLNCQRCGLQDFSCDSVFGDFSQPAKLWNAQGVLSRYGSALYAQAFVQWFEASDSVISTN